MFKKDNTAIVLGTNETGLAVARSLGRCGINVIGLDYKKDLGFYSRYIQTLTCPHPLKEEKQFIEHLASIAKTQKEKVVLFITGDEYLIAISRNRTILKKYILINISDENVIESIVDKYKQYKLVQGTKTPVPKTFFPRDLSDVLKIGRELVYPVFIKAHQVNSWRSKLKGTKKGYLARNENELLDNFKSVFAANTSAIVQELIQGRDTNHFKFCCYVSKNNEVLAGFTLKKIRQYPIQFGVGSIVESIHYPELFEAGKQLFKNINYRGVGSAEFKLDERDGKLKLIEINPRYWQQNILAFKCGINLPLIDYLDATGQKVDFQPAFTTGMKWLNINLDLMSFFGYRNLDELTSFGWIKSLMGKKVFSVFAWDDIFPAFFDKDLFKTIIKTPRYLYYGGKQKQKLIQK